MNCPFCKNIGAIRLNSTFKLWWCNDCCVQFSNVNDEIDFLIIYYKNFRICFFKYPNTVCFLQTTEYLFNWSFVTKVNPSIVTLPLESVYKKIEQLSKLVIFM